MFEIRTKFMMFVRWVTPKIQDQGDYSSQVYHIDVDYFSN